MHCAYALTDAAELSNVIVQLRQYIAAVCSLHGRQRKVVKVLEEDLAQKRKQVLTLKQSMDKQSSSHVGLSEHFL